MRRTCLTIALCLASLSLAQDGPYKVLKSAKVGGEGGWDYIYADSAGRRLYIGTTNNQFVCIANHP